MDVKKITRLLAAAGLTVLFFAATLLVAAQLNERVYLPLVISADTAPVPTPTPSPTPSGVVVLDNASTYVDDLGDLHLVGEVLNTTNRPVAFVEVNADLLDGGGVVVESSFAYTYLDLLPARSRTCFDVHFFGEPVGWASYQFQAPTYQSTSESPPTLALLGLSGSYEAATGFYRISGQVRNTGASSVAFVQPTGTVYNAQDQVVGCNFTFLDDSTLSPGELDDFTLTFDDRDYSDVDSFFLQVGGSN